MTRKFLWPFLLLFSLSFCTRTMTASSLLSKGAVKMQPTEVLSMVENNTLLLDSFELLGYLYFAKSGRVFARDSEQNTDNGIWDVRDDGKLCFKMKRWWFGDVRCFSVYSDEQTTYLLGNNDVVSFKIKQSTGDSRSLFVADSAKIEPKSIRKPAQQTGGDDSSAAAMSEKSPSSAEPDSTAAREELQAIPQSPETKSDIKLTLRWMAKDCPGCNLVSADLRNAELTGANLEKADLSQARLQEAILKKANLKGAILTDADLENAELPGADLRQADLRGANFSNANLYRADFTGADISGANFTNAALKGAIGLNLPQHKKP